MLQVVLSSERLSGRGFQSRERTVFVSESHAKCSISPKRASDELLLALFAYARQAPRRSKPDLEKSWTTAEATMVTRAAGGVSVSQMADGLGYPGHP